MKIGISNIAWNDQMQDNVFFLLREHKINDLEIAPTKISDMARYIKLCEKYGLEIFCLQSLFYNTDLNIFEQVDDSIKHFKKNIDIALAIGAKKLVFGSPKNRISKNIKDIEVFSYIFDQLEEYIEKSGKKISINIEANPEKYNCNFMTDIQQIYLFLETNKYQNVGIHFDTACHFFSLNKNIKKEAIFNSVHISEPFLNDFSLPTLNHGWYKKLLISHKYNDIISIEMKSTSLEKINKTLEYVKNIYGDIK